MIDKGSDTAHGGGPPGLLSLDFTHFLNASEVSVTSLDELLQPPELSAQLELPVTSWSLDELLPPESCPQFELSLGELLPLDLSISNPFLVVRL